MYLERHETTPWNPPEGYSSLNLDLLFRNEKSVKLSYGGAGIENPDFSIYSFEHLSCITLSISEKLSQFAGSITPKERKNMETNAQKM